LKNDALKNRGRIKHVFEGKERQREGNMAQRQPAQLPPKYPFVKTSTAMENEPAPDFMSVLALMFGMIGLLTRYR
jgi:hypothetical protein